MTADLQDQAYVNEAVLYMALELSDAKWRLAFGEGTRQRHLDGPCPTCVSGSDSAPNPTDT